MNSDNYMILTFLIVFIIALLTYYQFNIKPGEQKKINNRKITNQFLLEEKEWKKNNNPDKDLSMSKLKFLEYQNFLPGEQDIKIDAYPPYGVANYDSFSDSFDISKTEEEKLINASVPTLNTYQCWLSKEFECPNKNGSYLQCTNNYIPQPTNKNCDCSNRTFEMCPYPYKISENKYYKEIGFDRKKKYGKLVI